ARPVLASFMMLNHDGFIAFAHINFSSRTLFHQAAEAKERVSLTVAAEHAAGIRLLCRSLTSDPLQGQTTAYSHRESTRFLKRHHAFAVGVASSLFFGSIRESMAPDSSFCTTYFCAGP